MGFDGVAGQCHDIAAKGLRGSAFVADHLALARRQIRQKAVETAEAAILPMELLAGAGQQAHFGPDPQFCLGAECNVERRDAVVGGDLHRALRQGGHALGLEPRFCQEPPPGGRGEGDGDLEFRVIAAPGAFKGMRPVVVKDVFALTVRFHVKRRCGNDLAVLSRGQVAGGPAGPCADRAGVFQGFQKAKGRERVGRAACRGFGTGAGIPIGLADLVQLCVGGDFNRVAHAASGCGAAGRGQAA